jgi:hypothetical protein
MDEEFLVVVVIPAVSAHAPIQPNCIDSVNPVPLKRERALDNKTGSDLCER